MKETLTGIPASPGIVVGPVHLLRWEVPEVPHRIVSADEVPTELKKFRDALERARARLRAVRERAERKAGAEEAAIFDVQMSILDDGELLDAVVALIRQQHAAETRIELRRIANGRDRHDQKCTLFPARSRSQDFILAMPPISSDPFHARMAANPVPCRR